LAKYNPWTVAPKTRTAQTKEFQDIDEDTGDPVGEPFTLTFWRRTENEDTRAYELGQILTLRYVGDPDNGIEKEMDFPPVGGVTEKVTATTCANAAAMFWSQPPNCADKYSEDDFIAMRLRWASSTRAAVMTFLSECQKKKKKPINPTPDKPDTTE